MLIISNNEFLRELESIKKSNSMIISEKSKLADPVIADPVIATDAVIMDNPTYDTFRKPPNEPNTPTEVKAIIGSLGATTNHRDVAELFGVSKQTVGNLSRDDHKNELVKEQKSNILENIREKTATKIHQCVEFLEILKTNNKELLATAESLSRIHKNVTPMAEVSQVGAQFVFYVPESQSSIKEYDVIEADV